MFGQEGDQGTKANKHNIVDFTQNNHSFSKSFSADKKCFMQITSWQQEMSQPDPISTLILGIFCSHCRAGCPLNTSDATKLWGDECSGHLAAQRPDNCVAIREAQGYRHWPIIDTTADFLSPPAVLESGMRVHFSPFLIKVCFLVPSSWWHNSVRADIKSFL